MKIGRMIGAWVIAGGVLAAVGARAQAEDLSGLYDVVSPQYVKMISYAREEPSFKIKAPAGWFMATANSEAMPDRAIFFKTDPKQVLAEGHIQKPNIRIAFLPNPRKSPAIVMTKDYAAQIKDAGGEILLEPQEIKAGAAVGSHFLSLEPKARIVMDTYVFSKGGLFICVMVIFDQAQTEELKADIQEAVASIEI
jgi:hypothetical protein